MDQDFNPATSSEVPVSEKNSDLEMGGVETHQPKGFLDLFGKYDKASDPPASSSGPSVPANADNEVLRQLLQPKPNQDDGSNTVTPERQVPLSKLPHVRYRSLAI